MFPFNGKKNDDTKKVYIPVDLVLRYSAQGLSEPDIISRLEQQGFHPDHIDKALRIALREKVVSGAPPSAMNMEEEALEAPSPMPFDSESQVGPAPMGEFRRQAPLGYPPERIVQSPQPMQPPDQGMPDFLQQQPMPREQHAETNPATDITVEEIIEAIVAERWKDFDAKLDAFGQRDLQLQAQLDEIRKKISGFESMINEKDKSMISKLDEFGDSVDGIEGRIGSIERVFKDFLPELTTNIKTMSNLVETIKKEKEK